MELNVLPSDLSIVRRAKYKTVMNILRRALSFQGRRRSDDQNSERFNSIEMINSVRSDLPSISPAGSEIASTSRESLFIPLEAPSVYEDPFVAVTADGNIHVKNYIMFNPRAEFRCEDIHLSHVKKMSRILQISRLCCIYFASPPESGNPQMCKPWGITRNDIWWASHLNRQEAANCYYNIVLDDGSTLKAGFTVVNIDAFVDCLHCLGLPEQFRFLHGLPALPLNQCKIPYIDEDIGEYAQLFSLYHP